MQYENLQKKYHKYTYDICMVYDICYEMVKIIHETQGIVGYIIKIYENGMGFKECYTKPGNNATLCLHNALNNKHFSSAREAEKHIIFCNENKFLNWLKTEV